MAHTRVKKLTKVEKVKKKAEVLEFHEKLAAYKHLESNLISIIGYELWNPLSTIQVCLETLANEFSLSVELNQVLLDTAIQDVKYLRQLVQDCINVSRSDSTAQCDRSREIHNILPKSLKEILDVYQARNFSYLVLKNEQDSSLNDCPGEVLEHISSNFIAIIGHELRTPLCTIQVCLESLSSELEAANEYEEYKQKMLEIAFIDFERLRKLIKDFFILARLKQGQVYYRQEYVEIQALLELALAGLKNQKYDHPLPKINIELPFYLPRIKTDGDRLVEAITKVLDNACKFTQSQGEIKIQVQLLNQNAEKISSVSEDKSFLEVIISDTGRGIAPNNLNAIFNCFYQEENALKRTVNGVGIGLTICYQIIQSLGGKIWANSAGKEQGSSIHFTVPVTI